MWSHKSYYKSKIYFGFVIMPTNDQSDQKIQDRKLNILRKKMSFKMIQKALFFIFNFSGRWQSDFNTITSLKIADKCR